MSAENVFEIEAAVIADGLKLSLPQLRDQMQAGRVTSLCERGTGAEEGRHRLTFFSEHRRFRVIVDDNGAILQRSTVDFGSGRLPPAARKPGG